MSEPRLAGDIAKDIISRLVEQELDKLDFTKIRISTPEERREAAATIIRNLRGTK